MATFGRIVSLISGVRGAPGDLCAGRAGAAARNVLCQRRGPFAPPSAFGGAGAPSLAKPGWPRRKRCGAGFVRDSVFSLRDKLRQGFTSKAECEVAPCGHPCGVPPFSCFAMGVWRCLSRNVESRARHLFCARMAGSFLCNGRQMGLLA